MSYILEALKKAEAEREQGRVPSLRSQAWVPSAPEIDAKAWPAGRWLLAGFLVVVCVGAGLWLWRVASPSERPAPTPAPDQTVAATLPVMPPAAASPLVGPPTIVPAPPAPAPALRAPSAVASTPAPLTKPKVAKPPSQAASGSERVIKWADMTTAQQQALSKLVWGGAMHSSDPSARMVIINDQVMREGDVLGPGLVLEQIEPKSVVLNMQGQRIRKSF